MNQGKWENLNERLKLVADVSTNLARYASDELKRIKKAADVVSDKLVGHFIETIVVDFSDQPMTWQTVQIRLRREADAYAFPRTITLLLDQKGKIGFELPWTPMQPYADTFVTKRSVSEWEGLFASLIEVNLVDCAA